MMAASFHYPVYVVASRDGVVVVNTDGADCILLFHSQQLAEKQIEKIRSSPPQLGLLHALSVPSAQALREGLKGLPNGITCVVWDPTGTPAGFKHVCLDELLLDLS